MRRTNLPGHALRSEGKPYVPNPDTDYYAMHDPDYPWRRTPGNEFVGVALCECGETSAELGSDAARKRWHAGHKEAVINERMEKIRNGR